MKMIDMNKEINRFDETEQLVMPLELSKIKKILRSVERRKLSGRRNKPETKKKKQTQ